VYLSYYINPNKTGVRRGRNVHVYNYDKITLYNRFGDTTVDKFAILMSL